MWWLVAGYAAVTSVLFQIIYDAQPTPFIDEIFHVPQAQQFCNKNFAEWDPKITTLPGMYIGSFIVSLIPSLFVGNACSVWALRFLNIVYNTLVLVLSYNILLELWKSTNESKEKKGKEEDVDLKLCALVIGLFPLLYFYSFLYYTEPGSTFLILAAYLFCLKGQHRVASILSALSIIFRQTNVVWTIFMAGTIVAKHIDDLSEMEKIKTSAEVKDKFARFLAKVMLFVVRYLLVLEHLLTIGLLIWPYAVVVICFGLFVYVNNGVAVGDKDSHKAVLHLAQILYFSGFMLFFSSPVLITMDKIKRFVAAVQKHKALCITSAVASLYVLAFHTYEHPYMLADNRHYVFYLWRWILGRFVFRYCVIPVYIYAFWSINDSISITNATLLKTVLGACIVAVLAMHRLIEFRYFILPYILIRLHLKEQTRKTLLLEILLHVCVNAFTIMVFLQKTFAWPDLSEPQRIIW
uniref:Dol-P-Glc:Glc(2)Man(9)GlcNAc(2)-PP-Dol alpha-1,2-glucosyltransferase n=1 Tax=Phallusia mammillata TaxID=59560 RepID=A0A6F9D6S3_9ASCI|nr:putative Dol-P-Glc:Glc(2)Man(9)GlcNAc(2)-PP-Dol alpha-1,2-glucosyltransferase [Phallusia mammillata]